MTAVATAFDSDRTPKKKKYRDWEDDIGIGVVSTGAAVLTGMIALGLHHGYVDRQAQYAANDKAALWLVLHNAKAENFGHPQSLSPVLSDGMNRVVVNIDRDKMCAVASYEPEQMPYDPKPKDPTFSDKNTRQLCVYKK